MTAPPKVFISYAHGSPKHQGQVRALADRLRAEGIDAVLDQYEQAPAEGWPQWMLRNLAGADFVLVVCDRTYHRRVTGQEKRGKGLGVRWEAELSLQALYEHGGENTKLIPVLFRKRDAAFIPVPLRGFTYYRTDTQKGHEGLYRRLTGQPEIHKPELGPLRTLPSQPRLAVEGQPWNVPHLRNRWFRGREPVLAALRRSLRRGGRMALSQVISGLGGIGKTQTAVEYAYRYRHEYQAVLWVGAESEDSLLSGFAELARLLALPEKGAQDQHRVVAAVQRWLESNAGWLLIFDSADRPALLRPYFPVNPKGHVLLTSRARKFDELGLGPALELHVLDPAAALRFLLDRTNSPESSAGAAGLLAAELDGLPLALEQAAAYMVAHQTSLEAYLRSYRQRREELLQHRPVTGDYPECVLTTWSLNFEEVGRSPAGADLLRFSAFLSPDEIPLELVVKGASAVGGAVAEALRNAAEDPAAVDELLEPLARYSLIGRNLHGGTYSLHRLVQEVVRWRLDDGARHAWLERALAAVDAACPQPEFGRWRDCERLLPHALQVLQLAGEARLETAAAARLLSRVGGYLYARARYEEAEPLIRRALAMRERMLGPRHPDVANSLVHLAGLFQSRGRYAEAEPLCRRALEIHEQAAGPDSLDVFQDLNNLAAVLGEQNRYAEAEALYRRGLDISRRLLGCVHPGVATALNNLGNVLRGQRRYSEAEPLYREARALLEQAFGSEHPDVANTLNNLACLLHEQGRHAEAAPLYRTALSIREAALGPAHPSTAVSLANLAGLLRDQEQYAEAEPLFLRARSILECATGADHPHLATVFDHYARLLRATGRDGEAEDLSRRAAQIRTRHQPRARAAGV